MASGVNGVLKKHVIQAAKIWERDPSYKRFAQSTKYDVIIGGVPYPPKAIIAISNDLGKQEDLYPSDFSGVKDGRWHTMLKNLGFRIVPKGVEPTENSEIGTPASIDEDIKAIEDSPNMPPTTKATLVLARLGQGKYRRELLALWGNRCAVTGCTVTQVLRASHAKPWCLSDNDERLDANNGLPLVANLDALFDAGLIGFNEQGLMRVSSKLKDREILIGIQRKLHRKPTPEQARFLRDHLVSVFQK
ncbi:hypothetical protein PAP18089_03074 [Pandoraea apista]|uniref:Uncharacterized protein n=1 Tax=Pandoraea apista TaxID=93218 RepID=A0A5E5P6D5_9BURK|nr:HNH endonuclease signature motif containing protein [Pandoraea apista]VVG72082.1 hypothetical protein PAP18089_03074 [Pandoraea apista]